MKFRISSKDLIIFLVFCLVLLYLCAIGVLNLTSFGNEGVFSGLNPFPAFGPKYLPVTLILFFIVLVVIFTSVSSYVFDKEKGPGISLKIGEKQEKGYSRWAKDKEIKNDRGVARITPEITDSDVAGIPLINNGKEIWLDNGEYHNLVIGATGSGKSETIVKPMVNILAKKGESMIITDPKGELYRASAEYLKARGYKIIVLNFRDPQHGNAWNPLTLPYQYYKEGNFDKSTELLEDVALNILYDPNNKGEPFWEKSASDYFSGLTLGLFEDAKDNEINLNSINYISTVGEEKFAASNYIKEYFTLKGEASNAYVFASATINAPTETKGGILSIFRQKIRLFASRENLSEMLSHSDFDMRNIGREKTAVFIIIHDEKTTYHSLATIFIKQCYESLIDVAQENGGKLPFRTNFILDEFANMPPLKDVTTMVTAARSRAIRFTFIIQNYAQLKQVYGNENAETIKGNCGNLIYLISTELAALEEISKMCGEVKSADKDKTASTPLVTVTDLQKLKLFEAIIIRWRLSPFKTKFTPNFEMNWGHNYDLAEYPFRQKEEIKLFEIKDYVKEKKRQKMLNSLSQTEEQVKKDELKENKPFDLPKSTNNTFGKGFDLDAMMRDIDKKIAELDAEEAKQKALIEEKKQAKESAVNNTNSNITAVNVASEISEKPKEKVNAFNIYDDYENNVKPNIDLESKKMSENTKPKIVIPKQVDLFDTLNNSISKPTEQEKEIPNVKTIVDDVPRPEIKVMPIQKNNEIGNIKKEDVVNKEENKPKINVDVDSVIVNDNVISDDEFFDDFFGDDY